MDMSRTKFGSILVAFRSRNWPKMFRAQNVRGNFLEDPRCKMKNAARGCPRNLIWRPMCQHRIFRIWAKFRPMGPGPWLGWQWRPRILGTGLMGANATKSGPYIHQLAGCRLQPGIYQAHNMQACRTHRTVTDNLQDCRQLPAT